MELHHKIRLVRKELGLNQVELSEKLDISQNEVSRMESGKKKFVPNYFIQFLIDNNFDLNSFFDKDYNGVKRQSSDENKSLVLDEHIFDKEDDMNTLARFFLTYEKELREDMLLGKIIKDIEKQGENSFLKAAIEKLKTENNEKTLWIKDYLLSIKTQTSES